MKKRDARDMERDASPLVAASDAFLMNTDNLSIDKAFEVALDYIENK